jgi:death-on-curing family protein
MLELNKDDILAINMNSLYPGEPFGILDDDRLMSALGQQYFADLYGSDEKAIASVYRSLIQNHPFKNGNKRTAVVAMVIMADSIGRKVVLSDDELSKLTCLLADAGGARMSVGSIANRLFGTEFEESLRAPKGRKARLLYAYDGPIRRFGRLLRDIIHLETYAVSENQALSNLKFQAARRLGLDRASGAQVWLDQYALREVEPDDEEPIEHEDRTCAKCGKQTLNDAGECPYCDLGDESAIEESKGAECSKKITALEDFIEDIYDVRKESLASDGEYGLGNLVFKEFRALGYLDNLKELKCKLESEQLSLREGK